jgi:hypothetical protein
MQCQFAVVISARVKKVENVRRNYPHVINSTNRSHVTSRPFLPSTTARTRLGRPAIAARSAKGPRTTHSCPSVKATIARYPSP